MSMYGSEARKQETDQRKLRLVKADEKALVEQKKTATLFKILCLSVIVLGVISYIIYNRVILTELTNQITEKTKLLNSLEGENARLEVELDSRMFLRNVEVQAQSKLGLGVAEEHQKKYIRLSSEDSVQVFTGTNSAKSDDDEVIDEAVAEISETALP